MVSTRLWKMESAAIAVAVVLTSGSAAARSIEQNVGQPTTSPTKPAKSTKPAKRTKKVKPPKASKTDSRTVTDRVADSDGDPKVSNDSGRLEGDIVVTGLRENVRSARSAKRRAQQIVDVVLAQDIGKLPDKNVPEALARVPGVQIDRDRGEGGQVRIRGLTGVMTTVNGSPTFSAGDRTTYLNDVSSELVAGIEVYKTRTPDQVEGSQTGVINLTLRRPTDFKEGATYSVNLRGDYADQIKRVNPYVSALVAYNADTEYGKMGFSVNGTWNRVSYQESVKWNGEPARPGDPRQIISTGTVPTNIFIPASVGFSGTDGWSKRGAFQVSTEWKPSDRLSFVLEGGYSNAQMLWADSLYIIPLIYSGSAAPPPRLSNIVLNDDGRLVKSLTATTIDPQGPGRQSWQHETRNYNARFSTHYADERVDLTGSINYARSNNYSNNIFHWIRFNRDPVVNVIFNNPDDPRGGNNIELVGVDLLDQSNYRYIDGFDQSRQYTLSAETEYKFDLRLNTFWDPVEYIKVGFRHANRTYDRNYGARAYGNLRLPISGLPDYQLIKAGQSFQGAGSTTDVNWLIGDSTAIRRNFPALLSQIKNIDPVGLANYYPRYNPGAFFTGSDGSFAAYGVAHYNMKLLFPIEGDIGARLVNSLTSLAGIQRTSGFQIINGQRTLVETSEATNPNGNYFDILPSVNAIVHFTPKLQLRLAYTGDVGRPSAYDINPALFLNLENTVQPTASGGNASLGPVQSTKYDASLEWYFGQTGIASIAVWQWNQNGFITRQTRSEILPESPNAPVLVNRPYALGRGRHRGVEGRLTSFFSFLPGILSSFGGEANGTLNLTGVAFPNTNEQGEEVFVYGPFLYVSKYVYNLIGFFEKDGLNIRVAYNWRSRQQARRDAFNPFLNVFIDPIERLDASINYDVNKNLTIALEASNLTRNGVRSYWGTYDVPQDTRFFSRNYALSVRSRF